MPVITVYAYAKLNLTLDVLGKREDGYHDLRMLMQTVTLRDTIKLDTNGGEGVTVTTNLRYLPSDSRNIAAKAAERFLSETGADCGVSIRIEKHIPVCAGMAGGSADGAAVLRGLRDLLHPELTNRELARMGEAVGSDVPYCVLGGTMLAEGRGEVLTSMPPMPMCHVVICKPNFSISTPALFSKIDCRKIVRRPDTAGAVRCLEEGDLAGLARRIYNVFEDILPAQYRDVGIIRGQMIERGALGAGMSGTGPSVFGLFEEETAAREAYQALKTAYPATFLAKIKNEV